MIGLVGCASAAGASVVGVLVTLRPHTCSADCRPRSCWPGTNLWPALFGLPPPSGGVEGELRQGSGPEHEARRPGECEAGLLAGLGVFSRRDNGRTDWLVRACERPLVSTHGAVALVGVRLP